MTDHDLAAWKGDFGNDYAKRHPAEQGAVALRIPLFENILQNMEPDFPMSVLEVGAGTGNNLRALDAIYKRTKTTLVAWATEPNETARNELSSLADVCADPVQNMTFPANFADLVFTSGVLIHIPPVDHLMAMSEIFRCSRRWIACIEYFNPTLDCVEYHGRNDLLWRRDWGSMWLDNFPLKFIAYGFCWKRTTRLDNLTWWLFEKQAKGQDRVPDPVGDSLYEQDKIAKVSREVSRPYPKRNYPFGSDAC